ncbi:hypothetical protein pben1_p19 [Paracoccus phage vB_PbeS_Pben1]|nr:hypothetical protein pben1_p19 [Paracoccus phage vB_PbeS_Pben1]
MALSTAFLSSSSVTPPSDSQEHIKNFRQSSADPSTLKIQDGPKAACLSAATTGMKPTPCSAIPSSGSQAHRSYCCFCSGSLGASLTWPEAAKTIITGPPANSAAAIMAPKIS